MKSIPHRDTRRFFVLLVIIAALALGASAVSRYMPGALFAQQPAPESIQPELHRA
jgi:hypothetical protein